MPSSPVSSARTMSRGVAPTLKGRRVRSGGFTFRSLADGPSPRASRPWHSWHSALAYSARPRSAAVGDDGGAAGIGSGAGGRASAKRGENSLTIAMTASISAGDS